MRTIRCWPRSSTIPPLLLGRSGHERDFLLVLYPACIIPARPCSLMVRFMDPDLPHQALNSPLPGAVLVSGSNPNADYNVGTGVTYPTEYRVERFYPSYYNERRPQPQGLPAQLSYGGPYFNVSLSTDDLFGTAANVQNASVVVIRTGFSTHTMVSCELSCRVGERSFLFSPEHGTAIRAARVVVHCHEQRYSGPPRQPATAKSRHSRSRTCAYVVLPYTSLAMDLTCLNGRRCVLQCSS